MTEASRVPDAMTAALRREFEFYLANQDEMVEKYDGKVIAIKGGKVLNAYDNELAAFTETIKHHEEGTFMIQRVSEGDEAYTATFHSRVTFS